MIAPRLFLCSGLDVSADDPRCANRRVVRLDSLGPQANIHLSLEDVAQAFPRTLSDRLVDLLEIVAYVFAADCGTQRGGAWANEDGTEQWPRDFRFVIPVRDLVFWQRDDIQLLLGQIVTLLSDDRCAFEFCALTKDRPQQEYLDFGNDEEWPFFGTDRVLMFSGGLDSLAGAVETACAGKSLVLVSHRSIAALSSRQRKLYEELRKISSAPTIHVPVWLQKDRALGQEHTQRTRSLLYSALGTVVAESLQSNGVRFFENGIVSLNLPVADEVLRARASRTTNPQVLALFSRFYSLVLGRPFVVDNPYLYKTKSEVVSVVSKHGVGHLIGHTCSCAHTAFKSRTQWHCGTCSQCIDRRIAIIAAGQAKHDSTADYVVDVFTGARKAGYERSMAVDFARHATELHSMHEDEIGSRFSLNLARASRSLPNPRSAVNEFIKMHRRHGETVTKVLMKQIGAHAKALLDGSLDSTSMSALVAGQHHLSPSWRRYADRIIAVLSDGIPVACQTTKPKDEPSLQVICDALLRASNTELVREFPFMSWSATKTKPDWSSEILGLWIELKYVRKKADIRPITEAIAADITKYGDNQRRVLFVVYDPSHLVLDEGSFAHEILQRPDMMVHFIR